MFYTRAVAMPLFALLLGVVTSTRAAPITVNAGDVLVFNVDFGALGATPPPPYPEIFLDFHIQGIGENWAVSYFPELNLQGPQSGVTGASKGVATTDSGFVDGVFSASLRGITGTFTIDPEAWGSTFIPRVDLTAHFPISPLASVPEPATLALTAIALAGLGFSRRRRIAN